MLTAVKIVLIVVLVLLIVLALVAWWLISKFKGVISAVKEGLGEIANHPPCRVNPEPELNPQWRNPEKMNQYAGEFQALGFAPAGTFSLPEIGGLQIAAFAHEQERLFGVAYDHQKMPPNIDIVCEHEDGTEISATNTKMGEAMDRRPEVTAIRLDGGSVRDVFDAVQKSPATAPRKPVKAEEFAAQFRGSYAKSMNWRLKRGGTTREEIRRQAAQDGTQVTDEIIDETYQAQRESYVMELGAGCVAQYLDDHKPSPEEWAEIEHRVFAIPETFTEQEVRQTLEEHCDLDEEQTHRLEQIKLDFGQNGLDYMRRVVNGDIGALGLKKLGAVQEPVPAEIYFVERKDDDSDDES